MDPSRPPPDDHTPKDDLDRLIQKLDVKERETEKEFIEMSRPNIVGSHRLNWDGVFNKVAGFVDNLMWKFYGKDVDYHKQQEAKRLAQKQKETKRAARKSDATSTPDADPPKNPE